MTNAGDESFQSVHFKSSSSLTGDLCSARGEQTFLRTNSPSQMTERADEERRKLKEWMRSLYSVILDRLKEGDVRTCRSSRSEELLAKCRVKIWIRPHDGQVWTELVIKRSRNKTSVKVTESSLSRLLSYNL